MRFAPVALLLLVACSAHRVDLSVQAPATLSSEPPGYEEAVVTRAVDGDTIEVEVTGRVEGPGAGEATVGESYVVRMLGIDTPESVSPREPVECFGREASAATSALLDGKTVRLVKDVEERDGFDRLLRYVYVGAELANARLVVNGYAHAYTYPPNVRHAGLLVELQRQARDGGRGLWSGCPDASATEPGPAASRYLRTNASRYSAS
ncbi:MAG TPA: thermonuclease family protein [Actinomycetota bacterium]|nr:thermonuclease family protein [Actinomycetota bacterium]